MRVKQPLLLIVLTLVLLAVALILPAAAFGKSDLNKPVSWVKVNTNGWSPDSNFPDLKDHGATVARVEQLADGSLRGQVAVKIFREFWPDTNGDPTLFRYTVKTRAFTSSDWWDYPGGPFALAHGDFFVANANNWPADLGTAPAWWASYKGAAVADFVAYVPVSQYPESLPWPKLYEAGTPSIPYRFMFIDFGRSGKADVMLNWLFVGFWMPAGWNGPIQAGNIQVHVGQ
jgi:hypothetical protein